MDIADIPFLEVESSNIEAVHYDLMNKELYVKFTSGSIYSYQNVEHHVYDSLVNADSIGKFFGKEIRNEYDFERLS